MTTRPGLPPFWRLVEAHGDELAAHARRLAGDDAEDVLQEALLRGLKYYDRLQHGDHLRAWLYRVTTTAAFDWTKRSRRAPIPHAALDDGAVEDPDHMAGFEALIEGFSDGTRAALSLRYIDDLEYDEIARRLGCSSEAARRRVSTAVKRLREEMT